MHAVGRQQRLARLDAEPRAAHGLLSSFDAHPDHTRHDHPGPTGGTRPLAPPPQPATATARSNTAALSAARLRVPTIGSCSSCNASGTNANAGIRPYADRPLDRIPVAGTGSSATSATSAAPSSTTSTGAVVSPARRSRRAPPRDAMNTNRTHHARRPNHSRRDRVPPQHEHQRRERERDDHSRGYTASLTASCRGRACGRAAWARPRSRGSCRGAIADVLVSLTSSSMRRQPRCLRPLEARLDERPAEPGAACGVAHVEILEPAVLDAGPRAQAEAQLGEAGVAREQELGVRVDQQPLGGRAERLVGRRRRAPPVAERGQQRWRRCSGQTGSARRIICARGPWSGGSGSATE